MSGHNGMLMNDGKVLREGFNAEGRKFLLWKSDTEYAVSGYDKKGEHWAYWGGWYFPIAACGKEYARSEAIKRFEEATTTLHDDETEN